MNHGIKIVHTGDLHLGIESYGKNDEILPVNTRVNDFLKSLDYIIDYSINQNVDLFLIAGDIYEQREPSIYIQNEFTKRLVKLLEANISVVLLIGNHDSLTTIRRISSLQIFKELKIPNIYVIDEPSLFQVHTKSGIVQVVGLPYIDKNKMKEVFRNYSIKEQEKEELKELMIKNLLIDLEKGVDPNYPAILTAHLTVREAIYQNWRPAIIGNEIYISLDLLNNDIFSYVALGHIHKPQYINNLKNIAYCGSIDTIDFGEADFDHGFILLEIDNNSLETNFISIPEQRKFITLNVEIGDDKDIKKVIIREVKKKCTTSDIVKLNIILNDPSISIDEQEIRKAVSNNCFILSTIKIERKAKKQTRIDGLTNEGDPLDALNRYISVTDDPFIKENKDELVRLTFDLLKEIKETQ
ncbi:MAG: exonuclease SbcCD subunit D [Caldisericia bacterium]|jgi:exonuclease SbcD|nr:exonuclease SbcCD subunit D [Caldisericia bacterium]MDD3427371.1 exonuclease SbcCD subunit D [Caldisericia bacterium]HOW02576.1 exonuclease SbcCD subunit D [Caldisericia bacterium]HPO28647.1 exonuclease SbcCD subunit D [Caldisericia bacterium]HXK70283.1 exonuclease SbcCD subunit D [Caldisericia bacterium]